MVWIILIVELLFEILIRPNNYWQLIRSEKAYLPSTARYISFVFILGEAIALITYIPELACLKHDDTACSNRSVFGPLSQVRASMSAVLGPTRQESVFGRLFMNLMVFRFFGVIRHWKQTYTNQTFYPTKREGLEKWFVPYGRRRWYKRRRRRRRKGKKYDVSTPSLL